MRLSDDPRYAEAEKTYRAALAALEAGTGTLNDVAAALFCRDEIEREVLAAVDFGERVKARVRAEHIEEQRNRIARREACRAARRAAYGQMDDAALAWRNVGHHIATCGPDFPRPMGVPRV